MKERILEYLRLENKTSSQFAEEIGVQPSSVSHIVSGRNRPSLDFVLKMLEAYPEINTDWLLFGKGSILKSVNTVSDDPAAEKETLEALFGTEDISEEKRISGGSDVPGSLKQDHPAPESFSFDEKKLSKVVLLYSDGTFSEYSR